jgi:nucleoside 2-deoxyribosyltransferase
MAKEIHPMDQIMKAFEKATGFEPTKKPKRVYVASSWRNLLQQGVVMTLRAAGFEAYDFREPVPGEDGFRWKEIDPEWQSWTPDRYREALSHPVAEAGFRRDADAMDWADCCVLVLPCGRSAHIEAGYMAGRGKPVWVLAVEPCEPELMYKLCKPGGLVTSVVELLGAMGVKD